jgi:hypothetical protein
MSLAFKSCVAGTFPHDKPGVKVITISLLGIPEAMLPTERPLFLFRNRLVQTHRS